MAVRKKKVVVLSLKCERCGYEWTPRGDELPKMCASCNSPYWNVPRQMASAIAAAKAKAKRRR